MFRNGNCAATSTASSLLEAALSDRKGKRWHLWTKSTMGWVRPGPCEVMINGGVCTDLSASADFPRQRQSCARPAFIAPSRRDPCAQLCCAAVPVILPTGNIMLMLCLCIFVRACLILPTAAGTKSDIFFVLVCAHGDTGRVGGR